MTEKKVSAEQAAKMLAKVRALLAKADSTEFAEEAATYRATAERIMRDYKLEEEALIAADPSALVPEWTTIDICDDGEFTSEFYTMWLRIAEHVGVRFRLSGRYEGGTYTYAAQVVGYGSDLRVADLLYTNARLGFSATLTPSVDPKLSEEENIYRLRSAGFTRGKVAELLWGGQTHQRNAKVGSVYKAECAKRGETPALDGRGTSAGLHRQVYARTFALEIASRLRKMRQGADATHGALQMHGREERVAEALYERYPEERPSTAVAERKPCEACAKSKSGACRVHKVRPMTKATRERIEREHYSATAVAAKAAGRRAASTVDLGGTPSAGRLDSESADYRATEREVRGALGS